MDKRLDGKVAIVTGAGQTPGDTIGNGRAISLLFARAGARAVLVDLRLDSAQETQSMIEREGGESIAIAADVSRAEDCRRMAEKCAETYGRIDILVNNVGVGGEDQGPVKLKEEVWDRIFDRNLKSMFLTCKYVLPYMEKQGSGLRRFHARLQDLKSGSQCPDPFHRHAICQQRNSGEYHHAGPYEYPYGH